MTEARVGGEAAKGRVQFRGVISVLGNISAPRGRLPLSIGRDMCGFSQCQEIGPRAQNVKLRTEHISLVVAKA